MKRNFHFQNSNNDINAEINKIVSFAKIQLPLRQHFGFLKIPCNQCNPGLILFVVFVVVYRVMALSDFLT